MVQTAMSMEFVPVHNILVVTNVINAKKDMVNILIVINVPNPTMGILIAKHVRVLPMEVKIQLVMLKLEFVNVMKTLPETNVIFVLKVSLVSQHAKVTLLIELGW